MFYHISNQNNVSGAWGRIFNLYGPNEAKLRLIPSIIISLLQDQHIPVTHGNQIRDYLFVEDVANAFVTLLESDIKGPINIASGKPIVLKDIFCSIEDLVDKKHLIEVGKLPAPELDPPVLFADVQRLNQEMNWKPKMTLETGLKNTIEWWRKNIEREL